MQKNIIGRKRSNEQSSNNHKVKHFEKEPIPYDSYSKFHFEKEPIPLEHPNSK